MKFHPLPFYLLTAAYVLALAGCATEPNGKKKFDPGLGVQHTENGIDRFLDSTDTAHAGDDNSAQ